MAASAARRVSCAGGKGPKVCTSEDRNAHTDPEYLGKIIRAHDEGFFSRGSQSGLAGPLLSSRFWFDSRPILRTESIENRSEV
jgi:hypothetical protein